MKDFKLAFTSVITAAAVVIPLFLVEAHTGGLSPKDGCHRLNERGDDGVKRTVERHWHLPDTIERGGVCQDGKQIGNCTALMEAYAAKRADRYARWESEARAARKVIDCLAE